MTFNKTLNVQDFPEISNLSVNKGLVQVFKILLDGHCRDVIGQIDLNIKYIIMTFMVKLNYKPRVGSKIVGFM